MRSLNILFAASVATITVIAAACGGSTATVTLTDGGTEHDGATSPTGTTTTTPTGTTTSTTPSDGGVTPPPFGPDSGIVIIEDAGVPTVDGGVVVVGNPVPCGQTTCTSPQVCCETAGAGGGAADKCVNAGECAMGVSVSCTAETCPTGTVCCGSLSIGTGGLSGYTDCESACPGGTDQLCDATKGSTAPPCPSGDMCAPLNFGGGAGAGDVDVCRPGMPARDGGVVPPPFDGGILPPMPDAG